MFKKESKRGFTLMELMVSIMVLGILGAIALPQYNKALERFKYAEAGEILTTLSLAQERFFLLNSKYADKFFDLDIDLPKISGEIEKGKVLTTRNFEFSLEDVNAPNTFIKVTRKKNDVSLYSIYKNLSTGKMYCEDLINNDKITCELFAISAEAVTCEGGMVSITGPGGCPSN